jgi:hypothetical protein
MEVTTLQKPRIPTLEIGTTAMTVMSARRANRMTASQLVLTSFSICNNEAFSPIIIRFPSLYKESCEKQTIDIRTDPS